jgi:hypothetical protein
MSLQIALTELAKEFLALHPDLATDETTLAGELSRVTQTFVHTALAKQAKDAAATTDTHDTTTHTPSQPEEP